MKRYPALYIPETQTLFPVQSSPTLFGRGETAVLRVTDLTISREQFFVGSNACGMWIEPCSKHVATRVNGVEVAGRSPLKHGDRVEAGATRILAMEHEDHSLIAPEEPGDVMGTVLCSLGTLPAPTANGLPEPFTGKFDLHGSVILGRDNLADVILNHPCVSRRHAEISLQSGSAFIRDTSSSNGVFVNGERIAGSRKLAAGDRIDLGPYSFNFDGHALSRSSREGNLRITAKNLRHTVLSRDDGRRVALLDDISFVIEPNEFICLLGPTGSGKSTLMDALSARRPAAEGAVLFNDVPLYSNFGALKQGIAFVPQHNALHEDLTPEEALTYTARLRFPADVEAIVLRDSVREALERTDLSHRAKTPIRFLSGGQKRRVSLAIEIVSRPNVLFLDEVTSGLDEGADWEMMKLFRKMADSGMTVVCVTHSVANVEEFCHKVAVMTKPGTLAFIGSPAHAREYFKVDKLGDTYRELDRRCAREWREKFECSGFFVRETLSGAEPAAIKARVNSAPASEALRQFAVLLSRTARLFIADRKAMVIAAAQSILVAAMLAIVFNGAQGPMQLALLFFLGISSFWFGCNNASREIVKEHALYHRERDVNLLIPSYVSAKMTVLGAAGLMQVMVLFAITRHSIGVPGNQLAQFSVMAISVLTGTALGLALSAGARTTDQANTMVPIALIPQILLSGIIVSQLPASAEIIAQSFVTGWSMLDAMQCALSGDRVRYRWQLAICLAHMISALGIACWLLARQDRKPLT